MLDPASAQINRVASYGDVDGYLNRVKILDPDHASGPIAQCVQSGEHVICNDLEHEFLRPWKNEALKNGFRSLVVSPLQRETKLEGVFCLYAREPGFFDEAETQLLGELAADISFALTVSRHEEKREEAEIQLHSKTALLEAQINSTNDGILVVDPAGQMVLQNRRFVEIFRIPPELHTSGEERPARENASGLLKDPEAFMARIDHLNAHPMEQCNDEIEFKDGTILDRYSSPVIGDDGKVLRANLDVRDISERRHLEEQFRQAQKMEAIGQLTGGIAHDFNNLLAVIIGNLDLLERQIKGNEPAVKRVHTARNASLRGADLTHRLLAFARQEVLQPKAVDLNAAIRTVLALATPALSPEVQIITRLDRSIAAVFVDAAGLENALLNLVVNARDAMAEGGKLTITSELRNLEPGELLGTESELKPGGYAYVAVSDTGHGMTEEIARKAFEPFFTTKPHGTGLGLAMVYGFFKQSGGTVRIL